jgi:hypothetical protein
MTNEELIVKHSGSNGKLHARVMIRHGIYQGELHVTNSAGEKLKDSSANYRECVVYWYSIQ